MAQPSPCFSPVKEVWPSVYVRTATKAERDEIARIAKSVTVHSIESPGEYVHQARLLAALLPAALRETMIDFEGVGDGALLIRGLEVGHVPPTPIDPLSEVTADTLMAHTTALILSTITNLVGYRAESWGRICQCVVPTKGHKFMQTSTGSEVCLECHVEQAFNLLTRPDYIALGCNRGDPDAVTFVMSARTLQMHLPSRIVELLREAEFYTRVDQSFLDGGVPDDVRGPIAVLTGPSDDPVITYDEDLMWSDDADHQAALNLVQQVWAEHRSGVVLQPGDVLAIDNSRSLHGRSPFHPKFDGGDRYLCRVQGLCNLATTRHARQAGSPVIEIRGS